MKTRRNYYISNGAYEKLHDAQYLFRKEMKKKVSLSEEIDSIIDSHTPEQICRIVKKTRATEKGNNVSI